MRAWVMAEFDSPEKFLAAAEALRDKGYRRLDGYTPYPLHGAEEALGMTRSRIGWVVFAAGVLGGAGAYFLQWVTVAYDYVLNIGGRPAHSPSMFVPITFEMTVLAAAFTSLLTALAWAGLPRLWHPVFEIPAFEGATIDKFWVAVETSDPAYDPSKTTQTLQELGALRVVDVPGDQR